MPIAIVHHGMLNAHNREPKAPVECLFIRMPVFSANIAPIPLPVAIQSSQSIVRTDVRRACC